MTLARGLDADERQLGRKGEVIGLGPDHGIRLRAATTVLDRTGMGPTSTAEVSVTASLHLAALIAELDAVDEGLSKRQLKGRSLKASVAARDGSRHRDQGWSRITWNR